MRYPGFGVGSKFNKCTEMKRGEKRERKRMPREGEVKTEAESGVMLLQVKECQRLPATTEARKGFSQNFQKKPTMPTSDL